MLHFSSHMIHLNFIWLFGMTLLHDSFIWLFYVTLLIYFFFTLRCFNAKYLVSIQSFCLEFKSLKLQSLNVLSNSFLSYGWGVHIFVLNSPVTFGHCFFFFWASSGNNVLFTCKRFHITHLGFFSPPPQVFFSSSRPKLLSSRESLVESTHKQISGLYQETNGCLNDHAPTPSAVSPSINSHVSLYVDASSGSYQSQRGMCLDMAILDSAYLLSQVVPSLFMGSIVHLFSSVSAYMVCASVLSLLAVVFSSRIVFTRQEMEMLKWLYCRLTEPL